MIKKKRSQKNKKKYQYIILFVFFLVVIFLIGLIHKHYHNKNKIFDNIFSDIKKKNDEHKLLEEIIFSYSKNITVINDTKLYKKNNNEYIEVGRVVKNANLNLEEKESFYINDLYFKLDNLEYYIFYKDIKPIEKININNKYKNYIPFDFDILTKENVSFYLNNNKVFEINNKFTFPVIIKDDNSYHVEFGNRLYEIKKEDVDRVIDNPKKIAVTKDIAVLNYHFFYSPSKGEKCNQIICLSNTNFEVQLKYLSDNNFYTATMEDISLWMKKKIRLPKKTVVITIDDGGMGTGFYNGNILIPLLEKYDLHGVLFLISTLHKYSYISPKLELQSHGYDIHDHTLSYYPASIMTKNELVKDLKKSVELLDGEKTAFCYPFYYHPSTLVSAVKEVGFEIAFIGGNRKINQNNNPLLLPRYLIYKSTSLNIFINMVN